MKWLVIEDYTTHEFSTRDEATLFFLDLLDFYESYGGEITWIHADKVCVDVYGDEFFIAVMSEEDWRHL